MIRYGLDKDFEKAKVIWKECFLDSDEEREFYFNNLYNKDKFLVLEEDNDIKASLHENPYKLNINGNVFNSIYIVGVGVLPEYRGKGYMDRLIKSCIIDNRHKGMEFFYLCPINPMIYRKYGFEYISNLVKYSMKINEIPYNKIDRNYNIKKIHIDRDYLDLNKVYKERMKNFNTYVERDREYYKKWIGEIRNDGGEIYSIYLGEEIKGYIVIYRKEKIEIREIFGVDKKTIENLLAFVKTFKEYYSEVVIKNPDDNILDYYFLNQNAVTKEKYPFIMGRILNPIAVFKMIKNRYMNINIFIEDNIIEENNGIYKFNSEGKITFEKSNDWDIKINIGDLSSLLFGQLTVDELVFLEKIQVKNNRALEELKKVVISGKNYIQDYQ